MVMALLLAPATTVSASVGSGPARVTCRALANQP